MPTTLPTIDPSETQPPATPTLNPSRLLQKVSAEMVGTFSLVFAGCGAIMVNQISNGALGHPGVAATFGLVIMVMIYATGHISGAHFNPAVTVAFASVGHFPWRQVPAYVAGQLAAAAAAALLLRFLLGDVASLGATTPTLDLPQALVVEALLTFMLMFVITSVATDGRAVGKMAGLAIGGTVAMAALFGGPLTGASMNPARSLGPGLVSGTLNHAWLYIAAPLVGAVLGAWVYERIRCDPPPADPVQGCC